MLHPIRQHLFMNVALDSKNVVSNSRFYIHQFISGLECTMSTSLSSQYLHRILNTGYILNLTQSILTKIFSGAIKTFCNDEIYQSNPFLATSTTHLAYCNGPTMPIQIGFRSDRYLTTLILTRALYSMAPQIFGRAWGPEGLQGGVDVKIQLTANFAALQDISAAPYQIIYLSHNVGLGLYGWMTSVPYSIIVAPQEDVERYGFETAAIQNLAGEFKSCNTTSVSKSQLKKICMHPYLKVILRA